MKKFNYLILQYVIQTNQESPNFNPDLIKIKPKSVLKTDTFLILILNNLNKNNVNSNIYFCLKKNLKTNECVFGLLKQEIENKKNDDYIFHQALNLDIIINKFKINDNLFYFMRLFGPDLSVLKYNFQNINFRIKIINFISSQLKQNLKLIHDQNIIHTDIKLDNILFEGKLPNIEIVFFYFLIKNSQIDLSAKHPINFDD